MQQQELDLTKMKKEDIIKFYKQTKQKKHEYEEDIRCTEKLLVEERLDYMTVTEYKKDLIDDRRGINIINALLSSIEVYALSNGIVLELPQKQKKIGSIYEQD